MKQGRLDDALYAYRQAAERGPTLAGLHLAIARIHLEQGRLNEASAEIERELAIAPESAAARQVKAAIDAARTAPK